MKYFYLVAVAASLGCATASTTGGARSSNVITEQEIAGSGVSNAYEAVERLRPIFLQGRGPTSLRTDAAAYPNVYVGSQRQGDISYLRQIPINTVRLIRFYKGSEASTKFGMDNPNGVIEVTMKGY